MKEPVECGPACGVSTSLLSSPWPCPIAAVGLFVRAFGSFVWFFALAFSTMSSTKSSIRDVQQLHGDVQNELAKLQEERLGVMVVPHELVMMQFSFGAPILPSTFSSGNLCQTLYNTRYCRDARVYLQAPVVSTEGLIMSTEQQLEAIEQMLKRAAIDGGDKLSKDGKGRQCGSQNLAIASPKVLYLRCQCCYVYKGNKLSYNGQPKEDIAYHHSSYVNDRHNNRKGQGKKGPRRTGAIRSMPSQVHRNCNFALSVYRDHVGFYIKSSGVHALHKGHSLRPFLRVPTSLMDIF